MKKIIQLSAILLSMLTITGCLKDQYVDDGLAGPGISGSPNLVELMGGIDDADAIHSSSGIFFDKGTEMKSDALVNVRLASNDPAPEDVRVQLELAPDLLEAYNDEHGTELEELPADIFTFDPADLNVVIPKGQREGHLNISVIPNNLFGPAYAMAFRIVGVSDSRYIISGNFSNTVVQVGVKNDFDGIYTVTGQPWVDVVNPTLTDLYPITVHLISTGANSVVMFDPDYFHGFFHPIRSGANVSGYGSYSPEFTIQPDGKITAVVNYYGQPSGNGRSGSLNPAGVNQFNLETKEMKVSYNMLQPGQSVRVAFNETFTYVGPR